MGTLISRLNAQQLDSYRRHLNELISVIKQQDSTLAQLIGRITSSIPLESDLEELKQHFRSPSICLDLVPANIDEHCAPQYYGEDAVLQGFKERFELRQRDIQPVLTKNLAQWTSNPDSFWGPIDIPRQGSLTFVVGRLYDCIDGIEDDSIINPIRRRLCLVSLNQLRQQVEIKVTQTFQNSGLKVRKGVTHKAISTSILCHLFDDRSKRPTLVRRLRAGERYGRLPAGILLALGDVSSESIEKPSNRNLLKIEQYCKGFSPPLIDKLGSVATKLKSLLWDHEFSFAELNLIVDSYLDTNKKDITPGPRKNQKRLRTGTSDCQNKRTRKNPRNHAMPEAGTKNMERHASDNASNATSLHGLTCGRMGELLTAIDLDATSSPIRDPIHSPNQSNTTSSPSGNTQEPLLSTDSCSAELYTDNGIDFDHDPRVLSQEAGFPIHNDLTSLESITLGFDLASSHVGMNTSNFRDDLATEFFFEYMDDPGMV